MFSAAELRRRTGLIWRPWEIVMTVVGTRYDDVLDALADLDRVLGLAGNDILTSRFNGTQLLGMSGDDTLSTDLALVTRNGAPLSLSTWQSGGTGKDTLTVTLKADTGNQGSSGDATAVLLGGSGDDSITSTVYANASGQVTATNDVTGGAGNDIITLDASGESDSGAVFVSNHVLAGDGDDRVTVRASIQYSTSGPPGSVAENVVRTGAGNDIVSAWAETSFWGLDESAINRVRTGSGDDVVDVVAIAETNEGRYALNEVDAGSGNDEVRAFVRTDSNVASPIGTNIVYGRGGNDILTAIHETDGENHTTLVDNMLDGGVGDDVLTAEIGAFAEFSATGTNVLDGGSGDDVMTASVEAESGGGGGANAINRLDGGDGNDVMTASAEGLAFYGSGASALNQLKGGGGDDVIIAFASAPPTDPSYPEEAGTARNLLDGGSGNDRLTAEIGAGSKGESILSGGGGDDTLVVIGGTGNLLEGGVGADDLTGGDGIDWLIGGSGEDLLSGGASADVFQFDLAAGHGADLLRDFDGSEDVLAFSGLVDGGTPGILDDLDALAAFGDPGAGQDVTVSFAGGIALVFAGAGTGAVASFADLVDDPASQLILVWPVPVRAAVGVDSSGSERLTPATLCGAPRSN
ncbi:MAG: hypothetical protein JNK88_11555, partial [Mangrovicoccus sp.]|nr:hypothetical protein [Mangrovicoccus sp.]